MHLPKQAASNFSTQRTIPACTVPQVLPSLGLCPAYAQLQLIRCSRLPDEIKPVGSAWACLDCAHRAPHLITHVALPLTSLTAAATPSPALPADSSSVASPARP